MTMMMYDPTVSGFLVDGSVKDSFATAATRNVDANDVVSNTDIPLCNDNNGDSIAPIAVPPIIISIRSAFNENRSTNTTDPTGKGSLLAERYGYAAIPFVDSTTSSASASMSTNTSVNTSAAVRHAFSPLCLCITCLSENLKHLASHVTNTANNVAEIELKIKALATPTTTTMAKTETDAWLNAHLLANEAKRYMALAVEFVFGAKIAVEKVLVRRLPRYRDLCEFVDISESESATRNLDTFRRSFWEPYFDGVIAVFLAGGVGFSFASSAASDPVGGSAYGDSSFTAAGDATNTDNDNDNNGNNNGESDIDFFVAKQTQTSVATSTNYFSPQTVSERFDPSSPLVQASPLVPRLLTLPQLQTPTAFRFPAMEATPSPPSLSPSSPSLLLPPSSPRQRHHSDIKDYALSSRKLTKIALITYGAIEGIARDAEDFFIRINDLCAWFSYYRVPSRYVSATYASETTLNVRETDTMGATSDDSNKHSDSSSIAKNENDNGDVDVENDCYANDRCNMLRRDQV